VDARQLKVDEPRPAGDLDDHVLLLVQVVVTDPHRVQVPHGRLEEVEEVEGQALRPVQGSARDEGPGEQLPCADAWHAAEGDPLLVAQPGGRLEARHAPLPARRHGALLSPREETAQGTQDPPAVEGAEHELLAWFPRALERDPMDGAEGVTFHLLQDADGCHAE